jgi:hypothetical protein
MFGKATPASSPAASTCANATPAPFEVQLSSGARKPLKALFPTATRVRWGGATVLLVPVDKQLLSFYKTTTAGADGKYKPSAACVPESTRCSPVLLAELPPGDLLGTAIENRNPKGVSITVKARPAQRLMSKRFSN